MKPELYDIIQCVGRMTTAVVAGKCAWQEIPTGNPSGWKEINSKQ